MKSAGSMQLQVTLSSLNEKKDDININDEKDQ